MRVHRLLVALATVSLGTVLPASVALAHPPPYPAPPHMLTVSSGSVTVGETVVLTGTNFGPGEQVSIDVSYDRGGIGSRLGPERAGAIVPAAVARGAGYQVVTADGAGNFQTSVTLTQVGTAVITATGWSTGLSACVTVRVYSAGEALPTTGDNSMTMLRVGGGTAAGLLLLLVPALISRRGRTNPGSGQRDAGFRQTDA